MQVKCLLGPAGSGKTFRCLADARRALTDIDGLPLLWIAPKQATYQLERQLLSDPSLPGYTRLHVLSFDRLAYFIFARLNRSAPEFINEQGRLMVLRAIVARSRKSLKLFRAGARLAGFAQELNQLLREFQRAQLTPKTLREVAARIEDQSGLALKLQDLAFLLELYLDWLQTHNLADEALLEQAATQALSNQSSANKILVETADKPTAPETKKGRSTPHRQLELGIWSEHPSIAPASHPNPKLLVQEIWVDGFTELSEQELELLATLGKHSSQMTITFCLDRVPAERVSWLSTWSLPHWTCQCCQKIFGAVPGITLTTELLSRDPKRSRFANHQVLSHLERHWAEPEATTTSTPSTTPPVPDESLRVVVCRDPEHEAIFAARTLRQFARNGGRFRDATVLVRNLTAYHSAIQRVFARYEIPYFMDRREPAAHHPFSELTRNALRVVAYGWQHEDWFAVLKTGLLPADDSEIDRLETEALARGWKAAVWLDPIHVSDDPELTAWLSSLHQRLLPPFKELVAALAATQNRPTGPELANALGEFWQRLRIEDRLEAWAALHSNDPVLPGEMHATVWEEMANIIESLEMAFPDEALPLKEWLPILETGLASLTVGVIPPALDQVLVGTIDRSRNPQVKLALVLGLNEAVFPALPQTSALLTEPDRLQLEQRQLLLTNHARRQLGREQFLAYLACTRAQQQLILTSSTQSPDGTPLNLSPFLFHLKRLFPALKFENVPQDVDWSGSEHPSEIVENVLKTQNVSPHNQDTRYKALTHIPAVAHVLDHLQQVGESNLNEPLTSPVAAGLYGSILRTSVSRLEQFAACPFKFFVHSGLRAEERQLFELDVREQGTFQHEVLAQFHDEISHEKKRWRDLTPEEARQRVARIAATLGTRFRGGLLQTSEQTRFMLRSLTQSLQDFIETVVGWMRNQYQFDPSAVELPFGPGDPDSAWELDLGNNRRLRIQGRIDRIDVSREQSDGQAWCVVIDYKSRHQKLDRVLLANGLQLQLLTYLTVALRQRLPQTELLGTKLVPAGVFYVSLRGKYDRADNRDTALEAVDKARRLAYRHSGLFDPNALRFLDNRGVRVGDQFNYRRTQKGQVHMSCHEAVSATELSDLLVLVETNLKQMANRIFDGAAEVAPFRKGATTACTLCRYQSICRIDPWTHRFRLLGKQ